MNVKELRTMLNNLDRQYDTFDVEINTPQGDFLGTINDISPDAMSEYLDIILVEPIPQALIKQAS